MSWGYYAFVVGDDGHICHRIEVHCDNDEEAKRRAEQLVDGSAIELWQGTRKVATFRPGIPSHEDTNHQVSDSCTGGKPAEPCAKTSRWTGSK